MFYKTNGKNAAAWLIIGATASYALNNASPVSYNPFALPNMSTPCFTFCPNDSKKLGLRYCSYAILNIYINKKNKYLILNYIMSLPCKQKYMLIATINCLKV